MGKQKIGVGGKEVGDFTILCCLKNYEDQFYLDFYSGVQSHVRKGKRRFFGRTWSHQGSVGDSQCVGGDFNTIKFPWECNSGNKISQDMRRFSQVIKELELRYLPLLGSSFTWGGGSNNQSLSRLDRFLVSKTWESHFNGVIHRILPKHVLDHSPILLDGGGLRNGVTCLSLKIYS